MTHDTSNSETEDMQTELNEDEIQTEAQDPSEEEAKAEGENESTKLKDQLLRAMAELENVRKRTEREREDTAKYAISSFAREMLTVSDNLRRAIDAVPEGAASEDPALKTLIDGVEITEQALLSALEKHGIKKLVPELGDEFDHNIHQAMLEVPTTEYPKGTIAQVMQVGYVIHGRLLRPALVGVAKG